MQKMGCSNLFNEVYKKNMFQADNKSIQKVMNLVKGQNEDFRILSNFVCFAVSYRFLSVSHSIYEHGVFCYS